MGEDSEHPVSPEHLLPEGLAGHGWLLARGVWSSEPFGWFRCSSRRPHVVKQDTRVRNVRTKVMRIAGLQDVAQRTLRTEAAYGRVGRTDFGT